ncbi:hypothetical protein [Aquimarina agarivorans]|uniref:hypothetical protein n=1 Tax=Aquimarina agarivorans TaxID=980584 RepID=UPI000248FADE|nr:hypothetical protein [Aquimarina agarivorans]
MRIKNFIYPTIKMVIVGLFVQSTVSCTALFGPANFANESTVYQKRMQQGGTLLKSRYVSGTFHKSIDVDDKSTFVSVAYNKSFTRKSVVYAYGGYSHFGTIDIAD